LEQPNPTTTTRTSTPVIGGILSIVSAGITLLFVFIPFLLLLAHPVFNAKIVGNVPTSTYFLAFGGLRVALLISSTLAVIGGILAIKRKEWLLSLVGVIASIFSVAGLLGIVATILVAVSKKEFR
jgi:hypothetical protein